MSDSDDRRRHFVYGDWRDCHERLAGSELGRAGRFLSCVAEKCDYLVRTRDFRVHRSHGGLLQRFGIVHAPIALLLPALLALFMVFGPRPPLPGRVAPHGLLASFAWLLAAWIVLALGMRIFRERSAFWFQMAWVALLAGALWWMAGPDARQAEEVQYRHLLLAFVPLVLVPVALLAWWMARRLAAKLPPAYRDLFRARLAERELFVSPPQFEVTPLGVLRSAVTALLYHLLLVAYAPAVVLVAILPAGASLWWVAAVAVLWLLAVTLMVAHPRLDAIKVLLYRALFTGGQAVVSVVVVALGLGRLSGSQYVTAVVESSYGPALSLILLSAYAAFWFFEYWVNRVLCERLLGLLAPDAEKGVPGVGQVEQHIAPDAVRTSVEAEGRVVQIHGGARFAVIGRNEFTGRENFQLYEKTALFERLAPPADGEEEAEVEAYPRLQVGVRFYFAGLNSAILAMLIAAGVWIFAGPQRPEQRLVEAAGVAGGGAGAAWQADLRPLLFDGGADRDVLLLAASGGGTRAAMYTIGVLGGLQELGALDDVVLASGVSGGGAALAYFAGRRRPLLEGDAAAWRGLRCTLDDPFIQDVLDGAGEWRIFAEDRLGHLLAESFERRFRAGAPRFGAFGDVEPAFGLILNTAVAGRQGPLDCRAGESFPDCAHRLARLTRGTETGGRLIFTNLDHPEAFPGLLGRHPDDQLLNYTVVADPGVPLATAAALNANFPPVFPNSAVDLEPLATRYWVTDGGAVENRGILSLLFALRAATVRQRLAGGGAESVPRIHVLVAEASGASTGYSPFPGLGSKFGAPGKIGSQLMKELLEEVEDELERMGGATARGRLDVHYLAMPGPLRVDGGLGTHWMLAGSLRLGEPSVCDPKARRRGAPVRGTAVRNVTYGLFLEDPAALADLDCGCEDGAATAADVGRILEVLARGPAGPCWRDVYRDEWSRLREELAAAAAAR